MLLVMACSGAKVDGERAAALKYDARQHDAAVEAFYGHGGLAQAGHGYAILSAEFGFVAPTQALPDYDRKMDASRARQFEADAGQLAAFAALAEGHDEVAVYGGEQYRRVVREFAQALGLEVIEVVGLNRGCGDHFSALTVDLFGALDADA
jgi:hypothetical protein